jgi:two-component system, OmpR family, response regulator
VNRRSDAEEKQWESFDAALRGLDVPQPGAALRAACVPPDGQSTRRPFRVLVVDDEPNLRRLVEVHLTRAGYEVETASSGTEALERLQLRKPDLIVLDVMMPGPDGFEVLAEVKSEALTADIQVLMLTARNRDEDIRQGWGEGADFYLCKPFNPEELRMVVDRLTALIGSPDNPPPLRRHSK